jgi:hypothetical protein
VLWSLVVLDSGRRAARWEVGGHSAPSSQQQSPPYLGTYLIPSTTPRHCRPPRGKKQLSGDARASDTPILILTSKKKAGVEARACSWPHRPIDPRQNPDLDVQAAQVAPSHLTFRPPGPTTLF